MSGCEGWLVSGYSLRTGTKGNNRLHKGVLVLYKISSTRSAALGQTVSGFSVLSLFKLGELKDERKGSRRRRLGLSQRARNGASRQV